MTWCWLALLDGDDGDDGEDGATAAAVAEAAVHVPVTTLDGAPAGRLAAWHAGPQPVAHAVRIDADAVDPHGSAAVVSLVLVPAGREPRFDDPAVVGAMRRVLSGPPPDVVTTMSRDSSHLAGALTARRRDPWVLADDPFARLHPARLLRVPSRFVAERRPPVGPVTQRYAGQPWPAAGFPPVGHLRVVT